MTVPASSPTQLPHTVTIGVLALQGAFIEHIHYLQSLLPKDHILNVIPIRTAAELQTCDALVIPGGESTVISLVAQNTPDLYDLLKHFVRDGSKSVWGTCAGMILLAEEDGIGGGKVVKGRPAKGWGGIEGMKVWRNLYGNQLESFEHPTLIPALSNPTKPFNTIFIRAPAIHSLSPPSDSPPTEVLCIMPEECRPKPPPSDTSLGPPNVEDLGKVMVRQGRNLVTSFHPELSGDVRIHEYWIEKCVLGR